MPRGTGRGEPAIDRDDEARSGAIDFGPLDHHPAFQVHLTWRAIRLSLRESVRQADQGARRGSYSVPILIWRNPGISPRALADALHLDTSKVALFLRQLDEEGFLERVPSSSDGRKVGLHLTPAGADHARRALARTLAYEAPVAGTLSEAENATLVALLAKVQRGLDRG